MNRSVITGIALTAVLGLAGLAQAQTTPNPAGAAPAPGIAAPNAASGATKEGMQPPQAGSTNSSMSDSATQTPSASAQGKTNQEPSTSDEAQQANQQTMPGASHASVREAQQALKSKGLYHGRVDGVLGQATKTAISRFQQRSGLPQTAMLDQQTMRRLINGNSNAETGSSDTGGNTQTR
jgi:Putative peptidoglycan binding domain